MIWTRAESNLVMPISAMQLSNRLVLIHWRTLQPHVGSHANDASHLLGWKLNRHGLETNDVTEEDGDAVKRLWLDRPALSQSGGYLHHSRGFSGPPSKWLEYKTLNLYPTVCIQAKHQCVK